MGLDGKSIVGKRQEELFPPEIAQRYARAIRKVFETGEVFKTDNVYQFGSEEIWLNTRLMPLRDETGQITSVMGVSRNITDRKQTEQALRQAHDELEQRVAETRLNEARLEAVLQLSHMTEASLKEITDFALEQAVALTKSKIGYLAFMNEDETVLTMHSWSKEAMTECAISDKPLVYPLETTGLWGEAARQRKPIVTNDYPAPNPLKKGLPEGHVDLGRHMNVPILDGGHIVIVAGVGNKDEDYDESDVRQLTLLMEGMWTLIQRQQVQTELQRHRDHLERLVQERTEALQQSHDELRAIYDGMADGLLIADVETKQFVRANAGICRMLGYSKEELLSKSVTTLHLANDLAPILKTFQDQAAGQLVVNENVPVLRKDGSVFYADIAANRIVYDLRPCLIGFFRDITERRRAQEALKKEHRTLKHLLQSSDHERQLIAYEIHDELAQQLAGAIMQFQTFDHLKATKPQLAGKAYDAGMTMLQQGHFEARRLINGVRPPILDEEGIAAAITHLLNEQQLHNRLNIEYRSRIDFDRLVPILENAIYRIVQEGLANACQHSKSEKVRVSLLQQEDRVRIEIWDWGVGFDAKTVRENHFGLEGIRQRARLLGGKCSIRSKPGKGTRITVELPVVLRD
jgi:PAS domain S-box-containing protein